MNEAEKLQLLAEIEYYRVKWMKAVRIIGTLVRAVGTK